MRTCGRRQPRQNQTHLRTRTSLKLRIRTNRIDYKVSMKTLEERFNKHWIPEPYSGCWLWTGAAGERYGQIRINRNLIQPAHRVSYGLFRGEIPAGLNVCHRCDTPCCVNPAHLFLGTQLDNVRDSVHKGRANRAKGELNGHAKLTESDIAEIRQSKSKLREIAQKYGIILNHAYMIRKRKLWRHLP